MDEKKYIFVWEPDLKKRALYSDVLKIVTARGLADRAEVLVTRFIGFTPKKPVMRIVPDDVIYTNFNSDDVEKIIESHFIEGKTAERFAYSIDNETVKTKEKDVHNRQFRIVLRNCGYIDPEVIGDYIGRGGYQALEKALFELKPDGVIEELKLSGLRGRGGAGFPTGIKWEFTKNMQSDEKYVICNADEGDPGAYMDRSVLEGDPHSVIEGMAIAGFTVGAGRGVIYIRAEYPLAIRRLELAMAQARELGLLGNDILGSGFSFDIEMRWGAGAFVCGEETALIASAEGNRGMPKPRPPFPATSGLWKKPTVINNVETWANIPVIILKGGEWHSSIGTEKSKGTKVFALTGKVKNPGLIEVPMGTSINDIVFELGGGILSDKKLKAVQTGGPSGGVIPAEFVDMPVDYESLQKIGSMMGSGGMIVMDDTDCMVDVSKFYLQFSVDESCGKCSPCRIGGKQLLTILDKISRGKGEEKDIDRIRKASLAMEHASLCALGASTPNPVISTLKYFEPEYFTHIRDRKCPTGRCKELVTFTVITETCRGCGACAFRCPVKAISGEKKKPHLIDQLMCIKCGECFTACKFNSISRE